MILFIDKHLSYIFTECLRGGISFKDSQTLQNEINRLLLFQTIPLVVIWVYLATQELDELIFCAIRNKTMLKGFKNTLKQVRYIGLPLIEQLILVLWLYQFGIFPMIDISTNPLYYAAAGGVILGIATSLNYCLRGKVTGMSGIVFGIVSCNKEEIPEKISIIGGMLMVSGIFFDIFGYGTYNNFTPFGPANDIAAYTSYVGYALAGLLVGFGTKLSNGCTSGHGLCGLPRFSTRSFVAVGIFLTTAIAIATLGSYQTLGPCTNQELNPQLTYDHTISANFFLALGVLLPICGGIVKMKAESHKMTGKEIIIDQMVTFIVGAIFGCGLLVSGMVRRANILQFLQLNNGWNPSLLFVLGCGVAVNLLTFSYMLKIKKKSLLGYHLFNPANNKIDKKLVIGAFCFGLGWGIGGLCPGPAIMQFSVFTLQIQAVWFACMVIGMHLAKRLEMYLGPHEKKQHHHPAIETSMVENSGREVDDKIQNHLIS